MSISSAPGALILPRSVHFVWAHAREYAFFGCLRPCPAENAVGNFQRRFHEGKLPYLWEEGQMRNGHGFGTCRLFGGYKCQVNPA